MKSCCQDAAAKRCVAKLMNTLAGRRGSLSAAFFEVRAHISDGRVITGQLWCFDQLRQLTMCTRVFEKI